MAMMPKDKMGETMNKMMTNMKMPVMSMKKPKMEETEYSNCSRR